MRSLVFLLGLLKLSAGQEYTTNGNQVTITYNPGIDCLPYDGSVVPDCSKFVDPITKQPYFHEHSANCSRFWMCGPEGETCLVECAHCGGPSNPLCNGQWATSFDVRYQYPEGPVCDWPGNIDCDNNVCENGECCENSDCTQCPDGYCSLYFECVYPNPDCNCENNSDCDNFDGVCNVPAPHDPNSCAYCSSDHECAAGCIDNDNCPDGYECDTDSHVCMASICEDHPDCEGYDEVCNADHDNCFFCGGDCGSSDGCCQGCHDSDVNCAYPTPVCDMSSNLCGCNTDDDCEAGDYCDNDNNMCVEKCKDDPECDGYDAVCNDAYDNCFYCGDCEGQGCCPGCATNDNCVYPTPICQGDHKCGCNSDADCEASDFCNTDTNTCEAACVEDSECDGFDAVCDVTYSNCFYCGDCDGFGCCPGCSTDNNCVYPAPVCQDDHKCGCNSDADCKEGDQCNTEDNVCEAIPNQCETDVDCNGEGISGTCDIVAAAEDQTNCFFCESNGLYNECKPGCKYDNNGDGNIPMCPSSDPICDTETHYCNPQAGVTLLTKMVFTSSGCDGCSTEGVNMTLTGSEDFATVPECRTVDLDHPSTPDYTSKGVFEAIPSQQNDGWDSCYRRGLAGAITKAVVTWTGEGTWSPVSVCYDWDNDGRLVYICDFEAGTTLQNGQTATPTCRRGDSATCE